jgi:very-short-patch-repair endonuclease
VGGDLGRGVDVETGDIVPNPQQPHRDVGIGNLARRQHGVVTVGQLQLAGLTTSAVSKRVRAGRLRRIYRGVYAVGHDRLTAHGRILAAVLAYGPRAVASHRAAGRIHGLRPDGRATVDVSVPVRGIRSRPGVEVHTSPTLRAADITRVNAIPCTSVARTLLDLADVVPRRQLERALEQAQVLRVFDLADLDDVLAHADGRRGAGVLQALLAELQDEPGVTDNELEDHFLEACRAAGLPRPAVNRWVTLDQGPPIRADFLWAAQRLIVEVDGWSSHGTRGGFESDRLRDQRARLAGWDVLRFTRRQALREPARMTETVMALLAR